MGKIDAGLLKGVSGRIGNIILYEVDGETHFRSVPKDLKGRERPELKTQQARIKSCAYFFNNLKNIPLLETAWRINAAMNKIKSGYNLFNKMNMKVFNKDHKIGDFSRLFLTVGNVELPYNFEQTKEKGVLNITWEPVEMRDDKQNDFNLNVGVLYDYAPFEMEVVENTGYTMGNSSARIELKNKNATYAHLYCFFTNNSNSEFTNSTYFKVKL